MFGDVFFLETDGAHSFDETDLHKYLQYTLSQ